MICVDVFTKGIRCTNWFIINRPELLNLQLIVKSRSIRRKDAGNWILEKKNDMDISFNRPLPLVVGWFFGFPRSRERQLGGA
jgi:hypothetical protein